jgi:uncharacterized protein YcfL
MIKYFIVLVVGLSLVGCTSNSQEAMDASATTVCYDNVEYIYIRRGHGMGLAPHMKTDGSVYTCKE